MGTLPSYRVDTFHHHAEKNPVARFRKVGVWWRANISESPDAVQPLLYQDNRVKAHSVLNSVCLWSCSTANIPTTTCTVGKWWVSYNTKVAWRWRTNHYLWKHRGAHYLHDGQGHKQKLAGSLISCLSSSSCSSSHLHTNSLTHSTSHIVSVCCQPSACALAHIGFLTSSTTGVINLGWLCLSYDICALIVFNFCHLRFPLCITSASLCKMCFSEWQCV